jgi:ubiquinone biosynthesis protein
MRELLDPYSRLAVPRVHRDLSTGRLLVMEAIDGVPLREAPDGEARVEAATQLLESYCQQVLVEGFFHADPHPGNLRWKDGTIYFLDLGMVGELDGDLRGKVILLLLAFWRGDAEFLGEVLQMLSDEPRIDPIDRDRLTGELAEAIERFGGGSLAEMEIGLMMLAIMDVATRHQIRLPPALALAGKAFSQMQLAAGQLAPALDPFALMSRFLVGNVRRQLLATLDPQQLYYSARKGVLRASRLLEALERASGARPGGGVSVSVSGTQRLEETVERAGRRVALVLGGGMLALAGAMWHASRGRVVSAAPADAAAAPSPSRRASSARRRRRARSRP